MAASSSSGHRVDVSVKWGKKKLDEVPVDLEASSDEFQSTIQALTGVPAAKQKLLCKKGWTGSLKAGVSMSSTKLTAGSVVTLIGTAATLAKAAAAPMVFVEDLPKEAMASVGAAMPPGLANGMNNICYLNSTLQCLRAVPELDAASKAVANDTTAPPAAPAAAAVARSLGGLFAEMATKTDEDPVFPAAFLAAFRAAHPMFGERAPNGVPRQQDSEEFQSTLLSDLASSLTKPVAGSVTTLGPALQASGREPNVIDSLFGLQMQTTLTCVEAAAAADSAAASSSSTSSSSSPSSAAASMELTEKTEAQLKLVCNIQGGGGSTVKVNHMSEGLRLALEGTVEKRSDVLGRDAVWTRKSLITKLPKYLCVQFMRFYWMAAADPKPGDPPGRKFKIKRSVAFPVNGFDIYDSCAPELQRLLSANRDKHAREEDARRAARDAAGAKATAVDGAAPAAAAAADPSPKRAKESEAAEADDELEASLKASMSSPSSPAPSAAAALSASSSPATALGWGMPKEFEGVYELFAVVSHAGPDAESGHYMSWVRQGEPGSGSDEWLNFDDETVAPCKTDHVAALKGSGSETGDIAYITFFRAVK